MPNPLFPASQIIPSLSRYRRVAGLICVMVLTVFAIAGPSAGSGELLDSAKAMASRLVLTARSPGRRPGRIPESVPSRPSCRSVAAPLYLSYLAPVRQLI